MKPPAGDLFAELFRSHSAALLLYARQWTDAATAEDVVQEVFARFLACPRTPTEPRAWLFRCVRNRAISAVRSGRRRENREASVARDQRRFASSPGDRLDAEAACRALQSLPAIQREVVTLRVWSDLTLAEIGAVTGLAVSSVHEQYRQALARMRERMEPVCRNRFP